MTDILDDDFHIPEGLNELLHDFAVSVLIDRPADLYDYSASYFIKLRDSKISKTVPMYIVVDDDDECGEPDELRKITHRTQRSTRRKSVAAERYDPEADDSDCEHNDPVPSHPKTETEKLRLKDSMKNILLFRTLDDEQMSTVINAMSVKTVTSGEVVIKQGDDGDYFYVIDTGVYDIYILNDQNKELKVNTCDNEGSFGELALMYSQPRSATIIAKTNGRLWAMDRKSFQRIVTREAFKNRQMYQQLLNKVPMLKPLSDAERSSVVDGLRTKVYYDGDAIITAGEEGDGIYFIEAGVCSVKLDKKGTGESEIKQLHKGQYFGELALLNNSNRTASVYAVGRVKCGFLARDAFERLLGPCIDIMKRETSDFVIA